MHPILKKNPGSAPAISEKAAQTEFVTMTEINLREGKSNLQVSYESIFEENSDHETVCNRKTPKQLIQILIPEVEFHRRPKANESDPKSIKKTRNAANHLVEKKSIDGPKQMKVLTMRLHFCYARQSSVAARSGCFRGLASTNFLSVPRSLFAPDASL